MKLHSLTRNLILSFMAISFSSTSWAETSEFTVLLSPLSTSQLSLDIPSVEECTTTQLSQILITKCLTPNAELVFSGSDLENIKVTNVTKMDSIHDDLKITDKLYYGTMKINNITVNIRLDIKERNDIFLRGSIHFNGDQTYIVVVK